MSALLTFYALYLLVSAPARFFKIALLLVVGAWLLRVFRGNGRKPSLIARWRDEERRMAEAEAARLQDDDEDEAPEEDEEPEAVEEAPATPEAVPQDLNPLDECPFCDDDRDEAFCGLDLEKELKRLHKVLEGLYNRRDRMLYCYGCLGEGFDEGDARDNALSFAKLAKTKAWRGVNFDIECVERRIHTINNELGYDE